VRLAAEHAPHQLHAVRWAPCQPYLSVRMPFWLAGTLDERESESDQNQSKAETFTHSCHRESTGRSVRSIWPVRLEAGHLTRLLPTCSFLLSTTTRPQDSPKSNCLGLLSVAQVVEVIAKRFMEIDRAERAAGEFTLCDASTQQD